jgi:hypothetical protein
MQSLVLQRLCGWRRQAASFDCALRSVEKYYEKAGYGQLNPATAGLLKRAEVWQRSSGHDYTRGLAEQWLSPT